MRQSLRHISRRFRHLRREREIYVVLRAQELITENYSSRTLSLNGFSAQFCCLLCWMKFLLRKLKFPDCANCRFSWRDERSLVHVLVTIFREFFPTLNQIDVPSELFSIHADHTSAPPNRHSIIERFFKLSQALRKYLRFSFHNARKHAKKGWRKSKNWAEQLDISARLSGGKDPLWRLYWITHNNKNITFYVSLLYETLARHKGKHKRAKICIRARPVVEREDKKANETKLYWKVLSNYIGVVSLRAILCSLTLFFFS